MASDNIVIEKSEIVKLTDSIVKLIKSIKSLKSNRIVQTERSAQREKTFRKKKIDTKQAEEKKRGKAQSVYQQARQDTNDLKKRGIKITEAEVKFREAALLKEIKIAELRQQLADQEAVGQKELARQTRKQLGQIEKQSAQEVVEEKKRKRLRDKTFSGLLKDVLPFGGAIGSIVDTFEDVAESFSAAREIGKRFTAGAKTAVGFLTGTKENKEDKEESVVKKDIPEGDSVLSKIKDFFITKNRPKSTVKDNVFVRGKAAPSAEQGEDGKDGKSGTISSTVKEVFKSVQTEFDFNKPLESDEKQVSILTKIENSISKFFLRSKKEKAENVAEGRGPLGRPRDVKGRFIKNGIKKKTGKKEKPFSTNKILRTTAGIIKGILKAVSFVVRATALILANPVLLAVIAGLVASAFIIKALGGGNKSAPPPQSIERASKVAETDRGGKRTDKDVREAPGTISTDSVKVITQNVETRTAENKPVSAERLEGIKSTQKRIDKKKEDKTGAGGQTTIVDSSNNSTNITSTPPPVFTGPPILNTRSETARGLF